MSYLLKICFQLLTIGQSWSSFMFQEMSRISTSLKKLLNHVIHQPILEYAQMQNE
jgi:hypothetical protein